MQAAEAQKSRVDAIFDALVLAIGDEAKVRTCMCVHESV
jgi:hypothetical protein